MHEEKPKDNLFKVIEIEISSPCNLHCKTCPNVETKRPFAELPLHIIQDVVMGLAGIGYSGIFSPHFYNEPLLDKRLDDILVLVREKLTDAKIFLFTNFTLMTIDRYRQLYRLVDKFIVTVDEPVIKNAVDSIKKDLTGEELKKLAVRSLLEKSAMSNRAGAILIQDHSMKKRKTCSFARDYMTIDASGDVHLCCNDYYGKAVYGNIKEKDFLRIWFSREFIEARMAGSQVSHPLCEDCVWSFSEKKESAAI